MLDNLETSYLSHPNFFAYITGSLVVVLDNNGKFVTAGHVDGYDWKMELQEKL